MKFSISLVISIIALLSWLRNNGSSGAGEQLPNVILIMADDQGYGDLSLHGNPVLRTPHLDKLGRESIRFTDFHVAPMCTPTRGQLMTGVDALRNGATAVCQGHSMTFQSIPFMPEYFKTSGYATGHFGKWHLGDSYPHRPQDRGFDETLHHPAWGIGSLADHFGNSYFDPYLLHNGVEKKYKGYCTDVFFGEAMKWMEEQKQRGKPFFLYLPTNTPHVPETVGKVYADPYSGRKQNGIDLPEAFYGMIANLDENLGKLDEFLDRAGLKENTILIYLSDNGTQNRRAGEIYNAGMRGTKTSMYEGGHRVPLFIRWPKGNFTPNREVNDLTLVQDLLPTLIDLCALKPLDRRVDFNGRSLSSVLRGTLPKAAQELNDRKAVIQYSFRDISAQKWDHAIVLWKKWRMTGKDELYNVEEDPSQTTNVIRTHPDIAKSMGNYYDQWYNEAKPRFDQPRYITLGDNQSKSIKLYSNDWVGGYCDNSQDLVTANTTGFWHLRVEQAGDYEIELRRWPDELNLPIADGLDAKTADQVLPKFGWYKQKGQHDVGKRPIRTARIDIGAFRENKPVSSTDTRVMFKIRLSRGKTRLKTLFLDESNSELCSAIYVRLKKI